MFGLGMVSSLLGGGGPSKAEQKEAEQKANEAKQQRATQEIELEEKKRAFGAEAGDGGEAGKENKPKVCMTFHALFITIFSRTRLQMKMVC
jgi:hypothetical protein